MIRPMTKEERNRSRERSSINGGKPMEIVFDIETSGLLPDVDRIHVMSWMDLSKGVVKSTSDLAEMQKVFDEATKVIGHNIIGYDLPVLRKFGVYTSAKVVDTLGLSWYLTPDRQRHGLEHWGKTVGVEKPPVTDWENLDFDTYKHRCEEDVRINAKVWEILGKKLHAIYRDRDAESRLIEYINFKLTCAYDQGVFGWKLDVGKAEKLRDELSALKEEAEEGLIAAMPTKPVFKMVSPPKNMYKKDGSLSMHGERWQELLHSLRLPLSTCAPVKVLVEEEPGNPNSPEQVKDWLYSLGWEPKTFKFVRNGDEERKIEQVRDGSDLCRSVTDLISKEPAVKHLEDLTVLTHRLGIVKGFLECVGPDGKLNAGVAGLTNTLRFKHRKPLVNLPGVDKPWGKEVRGCLVASDGCSLIGCDMVSLEDTTKRHYMQPIDPEYVAEMEKEGYDPHLDLAKHAGELSQEDIDGFNEGKRPDVAAIRKSYKAANYACVYGVGPKTLARATGLSVAKARDLIEAYWERNKAVKQVAESRRVYPYGTEKWIYNEVSGFWYSLRNEKDRWSTTNQSTGVFVFDTFVRLVKKEGLRVVGQFHDEIVVDSTDPDFDCAMLEECIKKLNDELKLNVPFGIDYSVGNNYSEVH